MFGSYKKNKSQSSVSSPKKFDVQKISFTMSEAYNFLRANLKFSVPNKEKGKVIGITSAYPQEGKSYTSINLAYSLAKYGSKVLLIDADMRRSQLFAALSLPASPGLSNLLASDSNPDETVHRGVFDENLSILMSGDFPPNPAELLESDKMAELVARFSQEYEYILIDLPPVAVVADPLFVSKHLDGMLMVVRHKESRRKHVNSAVRHLKFSGVKIIGFIYNGYSKHATYRRRYSSRYYTKYYTKYYTSKTKISEPKSSTEKSN